ncbi:uncharacterized protein LOC121843332 [Oncorhynchus tshawytscha]|uniref:uncharacterized protein LOC121843332 n=1 Tax=Oncorhynchus tshawytscha TaxID=74940 RepID=UPI001C3DC93C|nr:uncharacterized protein LOC121843332 [Oncorhynchus tshawytscha]
MLWKLGKDCCPLDHTEDHARHHPRTAELASAQPGQDPRTGMGMVGCEEEDGVACQRDAKCIPLYSSLSHPRTRSKRLRTSEEPVALEGCSVLGRRRGLGGTLGPKVRRGCRAGEDEDDEEEGEDQTENTLRLPGPCRQMCVVKVNRMEVESDRLAFPCPPEPLAPLDTTEQGTGAGTHPSPHLHPTNPPQNPSGPEFAEVIKGPHQTSEAAPTPTRSERREIPGGPFKSRNNGVDMPFLTPELSGETRFYPPLPPVLTQEMPSLTLASPGPRPVLRREIPTTLSPGTETLTDEVCEVELASKKSEEEDFRPLAPYRDWRLGSAEDHHRPELDLQVAAYVANATSNARPKMAASDHKMAPSRHSGPTEDHHHRPELEVQVAAYAASATSDAQPEMAASLHKMAASLHKMAADASHLEALPIQTMSEAVLTTENHCSRTSAETHASNNNHMLSDVTLLPTQQIQKHGSSTVTTAVSMDSDSEGSSQRDDVFRDSSTKGLYLASTSLTSKDKLAHSSELSELNNHLATVQHQHNHDQTPHSNMDAVCSSRNVESICSSQNVDSICISRNVDSVCSSQNLYLEPKPFSDGIWKNLNSQSPAVLIESLHHPELPADYTHDALPYTMWTEPQCKEVTDLDHETETDDQDPEGHGDGPLTWAQLESTSLGSAGVGEPLGLCGDFELQRGEVEAAEALALCRELGVEREAEGAPESPLEERPGGKERCLIWKREIRRTRGRAARGRRVVVSHRKERLKKRRKKGRKTMIMI